MGFRFRKSINLGGGVRVNLSKKGVGYSFGTKGARVTKMANGKHRTTIGIPNTGLSYISESKSKRNRYNKSNVNANVYVSDDEMKKVGYKILAWVCRICFIPMIILGLLVCLVELVFGLISIGIGILEFVYSRNYFKKHKKC